MSTHNHDLQPKSLSWNEIKTKDGEEKDVSAKEDEGEDEDEDEDEEKEKEIMRWNGS